MGRDIFRHRSKKTAETQDVLAGAKGAVSPSSAETKDSAVYGPLWNLATCNPFLAPAMEWLDAWQRAARWRVDAENSAAFLDPREFRSKWFAEVSEVMDSYMRTPAFLLWMESYLGVLTQPPHYFRLLPSR